MTNISFEGSPVQIDLNSPFLLFMDPLALDWVRDQLDAMPPESSCNLEAVLMQLNSHNILIGCYALSEFAPGSYTLDPHDIRRASDEDDGFDDTEASDADAYDEQSTVSRYSTVSVDSGTLLLVDFARLRNLIQELTWERFDLGLQDESEFGKVAAALGGSGFAIILASGTPNMEFDGDGVYAIRPRAVAKSAN